MRYTLAIFMLAFILVPILGHAAVEINFSFPCSADLGGACPDQSTIPGYIVRLYQFGLGIAGILGVGMIVAGGILYAVSAGKPDKQGEAKDMITSALWGILLLFGAYVILNTINPKLVQLGDISSANQYETPETPEYEPGTFDNPDKQLASLAQQLLSSGINLSSYASCLPYSDPKSVVQAVAVGYYPFVCSHGCTTQSGCSPGGESGTVSLSKSLVQELLRIQSLGINSFSVISLTGEDHKEGSRHYQGIAADIVISGDADAWNTALQEISAYSVWARCEYNTEIDGNLTSVFTENCEDMFVGNNISNRHIHMHMTN